MSMTQCCNLKCFLTRFEQLIRCIIQKFRAEFTSEAVLCKLVGFCADMGEIHIPDVVVRLDECTEEWFRSEIVGESLQRDSDVFCHAVNPVPPDASIWSSDLCLPLLDCTCFTFPLVSFFVSITVAVQRSRPPALREFALPHCLPSPGLLHIYHTIMSDLDKVLSQGNNWLERLQKLTNLLGVTHWRKRFLAECVLKRGLHAFREMFERDLPRLVEWRWGTIVEVLQHLLPLEEPLRGAWAPHLFSRSATSESPPDFSEVDLPAITAIINDRQWWVYSHMLYYLHSVGKNLQEWCEGCDCHSPEVHSRTRGLSQAIGLSSAKPCPLAGKRSCYLAKGLAGKLKDFGADEHTFKLYLSKAYPNGYEQAGFAQALSDFGFAIKRFGLILNEKTLIWQTPPWSLALLAVADEEEARENARSILKTFDDSCVDSVPMHVETAQVAHRMALYYLTPGSRVRIAIQDFIDGVPRALSSVLQHVCLQFQLMPTVERSVEAAHSLVALQTVKRKVTGSYVSLVLRFGEVMDLIENGDPEGQAPPKKTFSHCVVSFLHCGLKRTQFKH
eukprot:6194969-Amphidinium_carterae.2